ncbi:MAG: acetyl-CoA carboxylase carboxyltransferase subunit alpha [Clostridiales bacterium]|jgi:acetyl-CoA carboxylase carboxyl transferase subunit alpha|nr:acetyl-CoA carboxylase carboxyltransferase subunit alpha [Clostridiales bacterium]
MNAWEKVNMARGADRPTSQFYISAIFDSFVELHGDRNFRDDQAIIGGIGLLNGRAVTIIAQEKGINLQEKSLRNFGAVHPEGYRKSLRLMKQAEKFGRPIVCFVDTQGAYCGVGAEERGQGEAIARNLAEMMQLKVPVISIILGEGGSGGALAIAVANKVFMLENAVYSILSPEGFASILWKDSKRAEEAAEAMKITASDLFELGIIDEILPEPKGGAQNASSEMAERIKEKLENELNHLSRKSEDWLQKHRYKRFRKF